MERFCTNCGAPLEEDALFCSECGEKILPAGEIPDTNFVAAAAAAVPAAAAQPVVQPDPQPAPQPAADPFELPQAEARPQTDYQNQYQSQPKPEPFVPQETEYGTITTAAASRSPEVKSSTYFWLMLLFAIPVVGLIAMLVMAFATKNKNIRHWCRAMLIWILIGLIVFGVLFLVAVIALKSTGATIDLGKIWDAILQAAGL